MKIDGHYDENADIAWLRLEDCEPTTVVAEETEFGLRELDSRDRALVGLEFWRASETLPPDLLRMLPSPPVGIASRPLVDVTDVEVIGEYRLRLTFADGTVGDVDFSGRVWRGVFEPLGDPQYFARVVVHPEAGTISWPDGQNMAPETLYAQARANLANGHDSR